MSASSKTFRRLGLRAAMAALLLAPAGLRATSIAAVRGQAAIDRGLLPLVCLEIATVNTALSLDRLVVENMDTGVTESRTLSNTFDLKHPDILTAASPGGHAALSLPILKYRPGRYRLKSIVFVGPGNGFDVDLSSLRIWFEVKAGMVNYIGGVELNADWGTFFRAANRQVEHNEVARATTSLRVQAAATQPRDIRWACSQIPGMVSLPSVISNLRND